MGDVKANTKNGSSKHSTEPNNETHPGERFDELSPLPQKDPDEISLPLILPPDGGYGWVVAGASFCGNFLVDGICYTFAVIYTELLDYFDAGKGKTALVGALLPAMYLIVGPIVGAMCNRYGCRIVAIIGSLISAFAFFISAFSPNIEFMLATYGFLGGVGFGMMYLPAIVMVGHYFDKKRALATGVAVCGSGVGTFVFAPLGNYLVRLYTWKGANILFGGIILQGCIVGALYRPLDHNSVRSRDVPKSKIIASIVADKQKNRTTSFESVNTIGMENKSVRGSMGAGGKAGGAPNALTVPGISVTNTSGSTTNLGASTVSLRVSALAINASSQQSLNKVKKELSAPFARKDVLYGGSIQNLAEYKDAQDMGEYVAKVTEIRPVDEERSRLQKFFRITMDMFKFELLKSMTFVIAALAGVFFFTGLYTPFVYVTVKAEEELKVDKETAGMILFICGICNTLTRLVVGWVADRRWVDLLIIHNVAAILAGASTAVVAFLNSYIQLCLYAAFFGVNMACFIALRSLVVVELLGVEKLNNAFGLFALFQGIAVLIGSPMSGALVDATGSYFVPFIVFGVLISLGGVICLPVRKVAQWEAANANKGGQGAGGP